jgi:hypothetical protein
LIKILAKRMARKNQPRVNGIHFGNFILSDNGFDESTNFYSIQLEVDRLHRLIRESLWPKPPDVS